MRIPILKSLARLLSAALLCHGLATVALAVPYATALKNQGGIISFTLNEPADNVKIVWNGGANTKDLGALPKGPFSTTLAVAGTFQVVVARSAPGGWVQTSTDTDATVKFNSPRGVAVNRNPKSPYFGRVYIANSNGGTAAGRAVGDGIYVVNADQSDAVGQGNTALTGGLSFASSASSPYRLSVGEDDNLYICDWSDATGNLLITDPDVSAGSGKPVLPPLVAGPLGTTGAIPLGPDNNHGSVAAVVALGSVATGNLTLFIVDEDLQTDPNEAAPIEMNSLWRFDVGAGPLPSNVAATQPKLLTPDVNFASQTMDLDRGPDGKLYVSNRRSSGGENGVFVVDESGTTLWKSRQASVDLGFPSDLLADTGAISVSTDGKYLAAYTYGTNSYSFNSNIVSVVPMVDGIPDLSKRSLFSFGTVAAGRDLAFDAAGNLHAVSSGHAIYRVYSPGGSTVATTGSDGTFKVEEPPTIVTVVATVDTTTEGSATSAEFTLTRAGDLTAALTVSYSLTGSPTPLSATFAAGASTVKVPVSSPENGTADPVRTVLLTILGGNKYTAGSPGQATATIQDNDPPAIAVAVRYPTAFERTVGDYLTYQLIRWGDTNVDLTVNVTYQGTAPGGDFSGPADVSIPAGVVTQDFSVTTVDNALDLGDRTVIATVTAGTGYTVRTPASAFGTILEDELPSEAGKILFADNFDTDTSANWDALFGANNNVDDKTVEFAYDYVTNDLLPPAPGGSNRGLKLTVNKLDSSDYGAAGVNLYPKGKTFSGDYALRFNLYLIVNASAGTTEHALFGLNHSGTRTNWVRQTAGNVQNPAVDLDGLFFTIVADASMVNGLGDVFYTGTNPTAGASILANVDPTTLDGIFKSPPFNAGDSGVGGSPANLSDALQKNWVDVEVKTVGDVITCSINHTVIFQAPNPTPYKSGAIMLGYNDQFDSIGTDAAVYFDNVRVVKLDTEQPPKPEITGIQVVGGTVQIRFTSASGEAAQFQVVGAANPAGPYAGESGAVIQKTGEGAFLATVPLGADPMRFYQIKR